MGTISNAAAVYGLTATGTPTKTNVAGALSLGVSQTPVTWPDANIAYSFKVTSTGASDVATLTISTGAVAQTTGTPTIEDASVDFEGDSLPTLSNVYAILVKAVGTLTDYVSVNSSEVENPDFRLLESVDSPFALFTNLPSLSGTIAFTFEASGNAIEVTIIGKSS